jgi:hypothetical protein
VSTAPVVALLNDCDAITGQVWAWSTQCSRGSAVANYWWESEVHRDHKQCMAPAAT